MTIDPVMRATAGAGVSDSPDRASQPEAPLCTRPASEIRGRVREILSPKWREGKFFPAHVGAIEDAQAAAIADLFAEVSVAAASSDVTLEDTKELNARQVNDPEQTPSAPTHVCAGERVGVTYAGDIKAGFHIAAPEGFTDSEWHASASGDTHTSHTIPGRVFLVQCEWCPAAFAGLTKDSAMRLFREHERLSQRVDPPSQCEVAL